MAHAVEEALHEGKHLIVQAGTGTGKTIAYLVPAIVAGKRTVVTTATKALQDQLAHKDLPFLVQHLSEYVNRDITFAVLKGRSNYVCRQRLAELNGETERRTEKQILRRCLKSMRCPSRFAVKSTSFPNGPRPLKVETWPIFLGHRQIER